MPNLRGLENATHIRRRLPPGLRPILHVESPTKELGDVSNGDHSNWLLGLSLHSSPGKTQIFVGHSLKDSFHTTETL